MLHDFTPLRSGDIVIQNGATSGVGVAVIQLARHLSYRTINVIRARSTPEQTDATRAWLQSLGADIVLTEDEVTKRTTMKDAIRS
jgi:trans-2-enoyl-CoA reductase